MSNRDNFAFETQEIQSNLENVSCSNTINASHVVPNQNVWVGNFCQSESNFRRHGFWRMF